MHLHFNVFSLTLLMSGVAALLVALVLFQQSRHKSIFWFALMMLSSAFWAIFYSFELSSSTLEQMLFWINLEYLGISFLPALWIMFVFHFIEKREWTTRTAVTLIFIFPFLAVFLVWTNAWHHIHYESVGLDESGPFPLLAIRPGAWYHVHTVYFYFLLAWGMFLLGRHFAKSEPVYRKQSRIILIGAFIPWITNFIYLLGIRPYQHIDLTPYAFIITAMVIAFGLTRYQLFAIVPFARDKLLDNISEGMLALDNQQRIIDINLPMQKFLRPVGDKLIGGQFIKIFHELPKIISLLEKPEERQEVSITSESEERFYEASASSLLDNSKKWIGTLIVFRDITEWKVTTEKLKRQTEELHVLNSLKNRMFSIIAHDLRSPLASLVSILNMAKEEGTSEEEMKMMLKMLSKDVEYTSDLADNLLLWAKSQLDGERIQLEVFDLKEITTRKVQFFKKTAMEKDVLLTDNVMPGTLLYADKNMIDLVLRNLLSNAIKFCNPKDRISIQASKTPENHIVVSVSDTGIGMTEDIITHLFELGTTQIGTNQEKGTGLGLTLCKDFIEKNGGDIWIESQPGNGSTFSFRLRGEPGN